jgi:2'-5' RNA ligase
MACAVNLRLDVDASARVRALWDALSAAGFANHAARLGYEPHLTLALLDDAADAARLGRIVREVTADWHAMRLSLSAVAAFPADPATLWLAPTVTTPLLDLHASLCAALPAPHPNYRPGAWIPHITLADDVTSDTVGAAIALVAEQFRAFVAILDGVDLVRFPPISLLWHARLAAAKTRG